MKRNSLFIITGFLVLSAFTLMLSSCQGNAPASATSSATTTSSSGSVTAEQKSFTLDELARFNGENGNPAYIAIDGKIYDVTNVPQWKGGSHAGKYQAGVDFTKQLGQAPHDASKLKDVPVVGVLAK